MNLDLKYGKFVEYYLKQNVRIKHFFLLNSANFALLLSAISVSYAKMRTQDTAGLEQKLVPDKSESTIFPRLVILHNKRDFCTDTLR